MKKLFRHITKVLLFSFVICLFLPLMALQAYADDINLPPKVYFCGFDLVPPCSESNYTAPAKFGLTWVRDGDDTRVYTVGCLDSSGNCKIGVAFVNSNRYPDHTVVDYGSFYFDSSSSTYVENASSWDIWDNARRARLDNGDYCIFFWVSGQPFNWDKYTPFGLEFYSYDYSIPSDFLRDLNAGAIPEYRDTNTDNYSLDKSVGLVQNARWKHLESKDKYNEVLQDALHLGTGTGDPGAIDYKNIYTRYAEFVQDKCSFATTSTTGVKIGGRYQLQYASRVGFTFAYNLPDLLEGTDFTKQYYKRFGSPKPYPIVNGTNFDANQNIQSLFTQAYDWNDSLPSIGTLRRMLVFKETKYWIDVRIIDTKNKTYGAWYAMDMKTNTAKEVVTDDGDIDSDVSSEDDAHGYIKEEGEGDTFKDAEDNAKEVDKSTRYDQKWYDDIAGNTKKSAPAFKTLLNMITGIPSMIATLFSWLPSWVLELVSAFFAIVVVLALLRFVLGS